MACFKRLRTIVEDLVRLAKAPAYNFDVTANVKHPFDELDTYLVYVLKLVDKELYYVGFCKDPLQRFTEHRQRRASGSVITSLYPPAECRVLAVAHGEPEARRLEGEWGRRLRELFPAGSIVSLGDQKALVRYLKNARWRPLEKPPGGG